jgi:predicted murein hydrolase (TIGR00659 family)
MDNGFGVWVYLARTPLLWLTVTLFAYQLAYTLDQRLGSLPLFNPVLLAIGLLVAILYATGTSYDMYFNGAQFIHFLLGPAIVALAVPLYDYFGRLRQLALPLLGALLVGSVTAVICVVVIGWMTGLSQTMVLSLSPKSATTPIAMGVSEKIGGIPSLTAVFVILTGIIGAVIGKEVLDALKIRDNSVRGFAIGLTSHGIGTARAVQINAEAGAFSGLAMGLNGVLTAVLVPLIVWLLGLD